ncbi:hypothetical protein SLE2022_202750 [Rubroshorea leprosula]
MLSLARRHGFMVEEEIWDLEEGIEFALYKPNCPIHLPQTRLCEENALSMTRTDPISELVGEAITLCFCHHDHLGHSIIGAGEGRHCPLIHEIYSVFPNLRFLTINLYHVQI